MRRYLGDRYGYGNFAPEIEAPERGAYLRWMVFSTAVFEPAIYLREPLDSAAASGRGWGDRATALRAIDQGLAQGPWLLGERFTAADVMLGALISIALFNRRIPAPARVLTEYAQRLQERPAYQRAAQATWG